MSNAICMCSLGLSAAALALAGCVSGPYYVYPVGQTEALDASLVADMSASTESTIRTAKPGELLFTQDVSYARLMVLENTVEPSKNLDVSVQRREFAFNEGDVYFQAIDAADTLNLVACSTNEPVRLIPKLNQHAVLDLKACFILGGMDDKVELDNIKTDGASFSTSQFFWVSGSVINTDFSAPYQALTYWPIEHIFEVSEPARFRVLEDEDVPSARTTSIGLRFMKEGGGSA